MEDLGPTVVVAAATVVILFTGAILGIGSWLTRTVLTDTKRLSILEQRQMMQHTELMTALEVTNTQVAALAKANSTAVETQAQIAQLLKALAPKEPDYGK